MKQYTVKCKYCYGKGTFSRFKAGGKFGDQFDGYIYIEPEIEILPCRKCTKKDELENISPGIVNDLNSREQEIQNSDRLRLLGEIEKMTRRINSQSCCHETMDYGYNQALNDIKQIINNI